MFHELLEALQETLFMVFLSGVLTVILGLPLGVLLAITRKGYLLEQALTHKILSFILI